MGKTVYRLEQEKQVIEVVQKTPYTMHGIAEQTGLNYYTVRKIVEDLQDRGILKMAGLQDRARLWVYNLENEEMSDFFPRIHDGILRSNPKFADYLKVSNKDNTGFHKAVRRWFTHVAKLVKYANTANSKQSVTRHLDRLHEQMIDDRNAIAQMLSYYDQVLNEPRFWTPKHLAEMTNDPEYNDAWRDAMQELKDVNAPESEDEE